MHALAQTLPKWLTDWHEGRAALRMLVAALAAYISTTMLHIPGPYSSVITTLIVARPHSGGVSRASVERLIATLAGATIACVATREWRSALRRRRPYVGCEPGCDHRRIGVSDYSAEPARNRIPETGVAIHRASGRPIISRGGAGSVGKFRADICGGRAQCCETCACPPRGA